MAFIVDNYLWFIISGFVFLMITIGYYAEKTNFGKKTMKQVEEPADTSLETEHDSVISNNSFGPQIVEPIPVIDEISNGIANIDEGIRQTEVTEPVSDLATPIMINENIEQKLSRQNNNISSLEEETISDLVPENNGNFNVNDVNSSDNDIWKF